MKKSKKSRKESTKHEEKTKKKQRNEMLRISENEEFLKFTGLFTFKIKNLVRNLVSFIE